MLYGKKIISILFTLAISICAFADAVPLQEVVVEGEAKPESKVVQKSEEPFLDKLRKWKWFERVGIKFKRDLIDVDIVNGLNTSLTYKYEVDDDYLDGYHTRIDEYQVQVSLSQGDSIFGDDWSLPINFGISPGSEIVFGRHFKSFQKALTAIPYAVKQLPFNAKRATKLNPGDFVSFNANLNLMVSGSLLFSMSEIFKVSPNAWYLMSGQFRVQVFKMPADRVRVKIYTLSHRERGASLDAGITDKLKIVSFDLLNDQLHNELDLDDALEVSARKMRDELFVVDYFFDLSDLNSAAARAYDSFFTKAYKFSAKGLGQNLRHNKQVQDGNFVSLHEMESVYKSQVAYGIEPEVRNVDRKFKGQSESKAKSKSVGIGLKLYRFEGSTIYRENYITQVNYENGFEEYKHYLNVSWNKEKENSMFFDLLMDQSEIVSANVIYRTNAEHEIIEFLDIGFFNTSKDDHLKVSELKKIQAKVKRALPEGIYLNIDWKDWDSSKLKESKNKSIDDVRIRFEYYIHKEGLPVVLNSLLNGYGFMPADERRPNLEKVLKQKLTAFASDILGNSKPLKKRIGKVSVVNQKEMHLQSSIAKIARDLSYVFYESEKDNNKAAEYFHGLLDYKLFQLIGPGFLVSLLPDQHLNDVFYFNMSFASDELGAISYNYPKEDYGRLELYNQIRCLEGELSTESEASGTFRKCLDSIND